ncbi:hypothetical protein [Flavobacterium sp.]|uniref:hypothetical protein n=1 Tax=Flavobacterium sp. TaxID=239 RepID=UPI002626E453|nr:hypothetical protein [Flavobacterium sp.]
MSDFKEIVDYLKFDRRSVEASLKNKNFIARKVEENYVQTEIYDENELIFVEKEAIKNENGFLYISNEIIGNLYLLCQDNELLYYVKYIDETTGISMFGKIPRHLSDPWGELDESLFDVVKIKDGGNFYYDLRNNIVIELLLEESYVFSDRFPYHPNDIPNSTDGVYNFNFKDEEGYTSDKSDLFLRSLFSSKAQMLHAAIKRSVAFEKMEQPGLVHLLPKITITNNTYKLSYNYYQKGIPFNKSLNNPALILNFKSFGAMAEFLNQTIFYNFVDIDEFKDEDQSTTNGREALIEDYMNFVNSQLRFTSGIQVLEILYYVPIFLFKAIDRNILWEILIALLDDSLTNAGINKEGIAVRIIKGLNESYENKNIFLAELINRKTKNKEQFIKKLFYRIDGENYKNLLNFLWDIWKKSTYAELTPEKNHLINFTDKNPLLLDYRSKKSLGFHVDNAKINWDKNDEIEVTLTVGTGVFETNTEDNGRGGVTTETTEIKETFEYSYHPFAPVAILNADNPTFIYKDPEQEENNFTKLPAFLLHTHTEKAFWENVMTTGEYTVDVITTISGFGNIVKFGRLYKVLDSGNKLTKQSRIFTKFVTGVKGVAGVAEITSGSVNVLLKLTGGDDTELGREISKYLFYFEMIALSGELSVTLYSKLQVCATRIIAKEKVLKEAAENFDETRQIELLLKELRVIANQTEKIVYEPLRFNKLYSFSAAALDGALNVSKNIFFYLKNLTKTNTETVFYKGVEIFTDSPAKVKLFLDDAAKILKAKGVQGVEEFFENTGTVLSKKRLHSQTGETPVGMLIRKPKEGGYSYEIDELSPNLHYKSKWNSDESNIMERFECKVYIVKENGKNYYTGDFMVAPNLNTTLQANKTGLTDISLGKTMYDDGFAVLKKDLGKEFDGIYGLYVKNDSYVAFGGESVNLTKFKEAMKGKQITEENVIEAVKQMTPYKWAKEKGFDKIKLVTTVKEFTIDIGNNINNLKDLKIIYYK